MGSTTSGMKRWMFVFPAVAFFAFGLLLRYHEAGLAVGAIGGFVMLAAGGYASAGMDSGDGDGE